MGRLGEGITVSTPPSGTRHGISVPLLPLFTALLLARIPKSSLSMCLAYC